MSRPYSSYSIDQLEAEFIRGSKTKDSAILINLQHELKEFRKTPRAKALLKKTEEIERLSSAEKPAAQRERSIPSIAAVPKPRIKPTSEQELAIHLFSTSKNLKINAYAGAGKTSTLSMLAHSSLKWGQYIAFNKSIVRDAKEKFPSSVNCSTTHGLAFRAASSELKAKIAKMTGKINAHQLASELKLSKWIINEKYALQPRSMAFLFLETVKTFAQSGDREPSTSHVPRHGSLATAPSEVVAAVNGVSLKFACHLWDRMCNPEDPLPLGHDGYLKLWALSEPKIAADFILLDEAQDTNPVVLEVLRKQDSQMIYVGDKYQQIYEWRGAVNAMERIVTDHSVDLTTSFRFGHDIADYASKILTLLGETKRIQGNPAMTSRIGEVRPDAILSRTNANAIAAAIEELDAGRRPHLVGGSSEMMEMLRGVQDLKNGEQSTVPDFFGFTNWNEVIDFAKSGEAPHLMTFVNLVESRGERQLMWALTNSVDEEMSDVTISTAHKAKGREWSAVRLMDDFLRSKPETQRGHGQPPSIDPAELRLYYVAVTRARDAIDIPPPLLHLI